MYFLLNRFNASLSLSVLLSFSLYSEYLPLPNSLSSKAVYYKKTKQLDDFSCGYNVLFNAANLEYCSGFTNEMHRYEHFARKSLPYIKSQGRDPKKASYNMDTEHLAQQILKLQPFFHLQWDEKIGQVAPLLTGETRITYPSGISSQEINQRMSHAVAQRREKAVNSIKKHLNQSGSAVIHFLCYIKSLKGNSHCVLLSLCQNETGRGLYLFDNLNEKLTHSSEILSFIEYLSCTFTVSKRDSFVGPHLPHRWQHLDRPDHHDKKVVVKQRTIRLHRD